MTEIKRGDKVKCIQTTSRVAQVFNLSADVEYTVAVVSKKGITFGCGGLVYKTDRFKKVEPK